LVDICEYELPTNLQNFTQKIPKRFRGLLFLDTRGISYLTWWS